MKKKINWKWNAKKYIEVYSPKKAIDTGAGVRYSSQWAVPFNISAIS